MTARDVAVDRGSDDVVQLMDAAAQDCKPSGESCSSPSLCFAHHRLVSSAPEAGAPTGLSRGKEWRREYMRKYRSQAKEVQKQEKYELKRRLEVHGSTVACHDMNCADDCPSG